MMGAEQLDAPPVFVLNNNLIEVYFTFHKIYPPFLHFKTILKVIKLKWLGISSLKYKEPVL